MHNFQANYDKILKVLKELDFKMDYLHQIRKPKLRDKELIAVDLTSEYMGVDSECQLFRILPAGLSRKIERSVYNRRKRKLFPFRESLRKVLVKRLNTSEYCFIVDSMPLEVCKLSRSSRSKICKEQDYSLPEKGYCASQSSHYYGYKLHPACSARGVIESMGISPTSVHDINYLKDMRQQLSDCVLLGDRGCLSAEYQLNLSESHNIRLEIPMRKNQHNYKE
ncbi:transposase [Tamlana sedimentorum]|uniref:Transposase n=1 Tax=Neotamlana sedimentorum TaxID=1435349 RepID=A0A0D7WDI3_9FLAO|nr:transposase [Tamlana sedimentorum]